MTVASPTAALAASPAPVRERVYVLDDSWASLKPRLFQKAARASDEYRAAAVLLSSVRKERTQLNAAPSPAEPEKLDQVGLLERLLVAGQRESLVDLKSAVRSAGIDVHARLARLSEERLRVQASVLRLETEGIAPALRSRLERRLHQLTLVVAECEALLPPAPAE